MKRITILLLLLVCVSTALSMPTNDYIVPLCKAFNKDLFEPNLSPLFSPTMSVMNATTNTGFFHSAYVPTKVKKPYFRFTLNSFGGIVSNDMKTFTPQYPSQEFKYEDLLKYGNVTMTPNFSFNIIDTAGFLRYILLNSIDIGIKDGSLQLPSTSATMLGDSGARFRLDMNSLMRKHPLYDLLKAFAPDIVDLLLEQVLDYNLDLGLPNGGNFDAIFAGVPQLEIGSLFGTELLLRFIPPADFGEYIGDFSFFGIGLKHSISQYFFEDKNEDGNMRNKEDVAPIDVAVQVVYQHTSLTNTAGLTQSKLSSNANIYNININASKTLFNWLEIYSGISYEKLDIKGKYEYILPVQIQVQIGLLRYDPETGGHYGPEPPEYPGDNEPQIEEVAFTHNQIKWTIGAAATLGPVVVFVDYGLSQFPVLGAGVQIKF